MTSEETLYQRFGREFPRGTVLFREGERGDAMFVVQRGQVRISVQVGGVEKVLSTLGPGEFVGEMSILSGNPRSATATCVEDARMLVVDGRTFEAMLRANSEIAIRMIRKLAERLQRANEQIENLLLPDASQRVVHHLVIAAEREQRGAGGSVRLPFGASEIAQQAGVGLGQVDVVLERLVRAKLLDATAGLQVPDVARLRRYLDLLQLKAQFGEGP
jgi:CRP-like cAMP-binding protein